MHLKTKLLIASLCSMMFSFLPSVHQPVYSQVEGEAEGETLAVKACGFSMWLPQKPTNSQELAGVALFVIKQGNQGYSIAVQTREKAQQNATDETALKAFIDEHLKGFRLSGERAREKVSGEEAIGPAEGKGWKGQRYKMKRGRNDLIVNYGIGKSCCFVVSVINNNLEDKVVAKVLNSITCSPETSNTP